MKMFLVSNREYITARDGRVVTFGLSEEENRMTENALPTKSYELFKTDVPTDLIAISGVALIINAATLDT